jgi:hypothetical protein
VAGVTLLLSLPVDLEAWLILGYVVVVLIGARVIEALAQAHFGRARRSAEQGFEYDVDGDHYQCPQGERLALHRVETKGRLAVYRAPASSCNACSLKASCTPHDEGRHIYRPLAVWAETDIARFHQALSVLMIGVAVVICCAGLIRWAGRPGAGLLTMTLVASFATLVLEVRKMRTGAGARKTEEP